MLDIEDSMLSNLESADYNGFIKIGAEYADAVIKAEDEFKDNLDELFSTIEKNKKNRYY